MMWEAPRSSSSGRLSSCHAGLAGGAVPAQVAQGSRGVLVEQDGQFVGRPEQEQGLAQLQFQADEAGALIFAGAGAPGRAGDGLAVDGDHGWRSAWWVACCLAMAWASWILMAAPWLSRRASWFLVMAT